MSEKAQDLIIDEVQTITNPFPDPETGFLRNMGHVSTGVIHFCPSRISIFPDKYQVVRVLNHPPPCNSADFLP